MEKAKSWTSKIIARLGKRPPANENTACGVAGCMDGQLVLVAGTEKSLTLMCTRHAMAWAKSSACRDVAQHNSGASLDSLAGWVQAHS
jgi:hypothetical protein